MRILSNQRRQVKDKLVRCERSEATPGDDRARRAGTEVCGRDDEHYRTPAHTDDQRSDKVRSASAAIPASADARRPLFSAVTTTDPAGTARKAHDPSPVVR